MKPPSTSQPNANKYTGQGPQYRYQAAIEDPTVTKALLDCALDVPLQTTTRELLATSLDIRKQFREMIMSKKVSTNTFIEDPTFPIAAESFLQEHSAFYNDTDVIAKHSLPLRVVYPEFENGIRPECILDGGAQIIAMCKDIWE